MISVILYGRNDAHGYNLHRRAALSLNCIAEVLTDPDDEIIFVDYNTPDELPTFVEAIAGVKLERRYNLDAPKGVRGRNSDNTRLREVLGWEPGISLEDGLAPTYRWIEAEVERLAGEPAVPGVLSSA